MKRLILNITFLFVTAVFGSNRFVMYDFGRGVNQDTIKNLKWKKENTQTYFIDLPEGLDTLEFKASIYLDRHKQFHQIKFPNGGTSTNVYIYDSTYLKSILSNTLPRIKYLDQGNFNIDQEVILDITSFQPGKYYVHYTSCNLGGFFPLTIN
jgi:hypothetical protein